MSLNSLPSLIRSINLFSLRIGSFIDLVPWYFVEEGLKVHYLSWLSSISSSVGRLGFLFAYAFLLLSYSLWQRSLLLPVWEDSVFTESFGLLILGWKVQPLCSSWFFSLSLSCIFSSFTFLSSIMSSARSMHSWAGGRISQYCCTSRSILLRLACAISREYSNMWGWNFGYSSF